MKKASIRKLCSMSILIRLTALLLTLCLLPIFAVAETQAEAKGWVDFLAVKSHNASFGGVD